MHHENLIDGLWYRELEIHSALHLDYGRRSPSKIKLCLLSTTLVRLNIVKNTWNC